MYRHYNLVVNNAFYHTVFRTASGSLGLGLHGLRKGDQIAIVAGCRQPLIVRPEGNRFRFVGLGFLYDIMDGSRWPEDEQMLQDIVLV